MVCICDVAVVVVAAHVDKKEEKRLQTKKPLNYLTLC